METRAKRSTIAAMIAFLILCLSNIGHACLKNDTAGYSGEYIIVFSRGITWEEAAQEVASWGTSYHLATITSQEEQKYFTKLLNGLRGEFWIGGYYKSESQWQWATGEPWSYSNKNIEFPDFYLTMSVGKFGSKWRWHKEGSYKFISGFIAEKDRINPNPVPLPPALMLFGSGLTAVGGLRTIWRKKKYREIMNRR